MLFRPHLSLVFAVPSMIALSFVAVTFPVSAATTDLKKEIETKIQQVQATAAPTLKVGAATCPAKLGGAPKKIPIGTYTCTVVIEGVSAPYTVVIKDGGFLKSGVYSIAPAKAIIDLTKVVGFVRNSLDPKEAPLAKINCGKGVVVVLEPTSTIVCAVTVAASVQKYTFVVKDVNGTIALRSTPGSTGASTSVSPKLVSPASGSSTIVSPSTSKKAA